MDFSHTSPHKNGVIIRTRGFRRYFVEMFSVNHTTSILDLGFVWIGSELFIFRLYSSENSSS